MLFLNRYKQGLRPCPSLRDSDVWELKGNFVQGDRQTGPPWTQEQRYPDSTSSPTGNDALLQTRPKFC